MNRALVLTLAATAVWALGGVWYYDCKIKRVCGPENIAAAAAPPAAAPTQPATPAAAKSTVSSKSVQAIAAAPQPIVTAGPQLVLSVSFDARSAAVMPPPDIEARMVILRQGIAQGRKVLVLGHSDGRGARERIAVVSQQRADALRDWLLTQGIPTDAIAAVESREDREPIASNSREDGRRLNRRADAVLTAQE